MIKYALITPARNEEEFIEKTIQSVVAQTITPQAWVIVNDGSTDSTADIVEKYKTDNPFIQLINIAGDSDRNFGSKAKAVEYAYEQLADKEFDYIGNLDADISFDPDYYENILNELEANPQLGLAGGIRYDWHEKDGQFKLVRPSSNSVGGPIQLFRRDCWEAIGGYMALPYGGIDAVAEISTRMKGWEVRSFPQYQVYHHRETGTAKRSPSQARFRAGIRDYTIGYHPLFELTRAVKWLAKPPYIIGGIYMMAGYLYAMLKGIERPVSDELVNYLHDEQMGRLRGVIKGSG